MPNTGPNHASEHPLRDEHRPASGGKSVVILGGGQLGAMLAEAAGHMGIRAIGVSASETDPIRRWCDHHVVADPTDPAMAARVARGGCVVTVETESIPPEVLEAAEAAGCRAAPAAGAQRVVRDRRLEKTFLSENQLPVGPFRIVESAGAMAEAFAQLAVSAPARPAGAGTVVAKTARGGYDGRGQRWLKSAEQARTAWEALGSQPLVLEQAVPFVAEASVIVARGAGGQSSTLPMFRNEHRNGILFQTVSPTGFSPAVEQRAMAAAERVAQRLGVVGLLAVEMFVLADGQVLINELAARPHNSGHLSLRACTLSQFELHLAAIMDLPLPPVNLLQPAVMTNLLGDLWNRGAPDLKLILQDSGANVQLYGKSPRPGRKMGHMIHLGHTAEEAQAAANAAMARLRAAAGIAA